MAVKHISPTVNVTEIDRSSYTLPPSKTSLLLIGEASKGEINTPTVVTSTDDLKAKFGKQLDNAFLIQAARNYLSFSSDLIIVRTAYDQNITFVGTVKEKYNISSSNNKMKVALNGAITGVTVALDNFTDGSANQVASNITANLASSSLTDVSAEVTASKRINLVGNSNVKEIELQSITNDCYDVFGWTETEATLERAWYAQKNIIYTTPPSLESDSLTGADWSTITGSNLLVLGENNNDLVTYTLVSTATVLPGTTVASILASQLEDQRDTETTHYYFSAVGDKLKVVGSSLETNKLVLNNSAIAGANATLGGDFAIADGSEATFLEATTVLGKFRARTKGTDGNTLKVTYGTNNLNEDTLYVYYNNQVAAEEEISGWNFDETDSTYYIENYVEEESDLISVEWDVEATDKFDKKQYVLSGGQNGINDDNSTERINAFDTEIKNPELWSFNLVSVPGETSTAGIAAVLDFCGNVRSDCFGIVDSPYGLDEDEIVTWHNGEGEGNSVKFNSSYGALYWPWILGTNSDTGLDIWYPPSVYMPALYAKSDSNYDPWYPPAGADRGSIPGIYLDVETSPEIGKRDIMYGKTGNNVNPIVTFKSIGTVVWGQKTLQRTLSALDRVNVRRMVLHVEKGIVDIAQPLLFELNTPVVWQEFTDKSNRFLADIQKRYGLTDYLVVCDSTTNTPEIIDQNKMVGKIFLKPVKSIEVIDLYFTITSAGGSFTE